jgi:hypothetical protein
MDSPAQALIDQVSELRHLMKTTAQPDRVVATLVCFDDWATIFRTF